MGLDRTRRCELLRSGSRTSPTTGSARCSTRAGRTGHCSGTSLRAEPPVRRLEERRDRTGRVHAPPTTRLPAELKRPPEEQLSAVELHDTTTGRLRRHPAGAAQPIPAHGLDLHHETRLVLGDGEHLHAGDAEHHLKHHIRVARHHTRFQHEPEASTRTSSPRQLRPPGDPKSQ